MKDYRFDALVHGLRRYDKRYAYSLAASEELRINDEIAADYTPEMHDDFWSELEKEYLEGSND